MGGARAFLGAAVVASRLADRAHVRAREAERRTREADALAGLAGALLAAAAVEQARAVLAARLSEAFGLASASVELRTMREGALPPPAGAVKPLAALGLAAAPRPTGDSAIRASAIG